MTIERMVDPPDGSGGQTEYWEAIGSAWVRAVPAGGSEALVAGSMQASQPWRIETRFGLDVTERDRIAADWLPSPRHRISIESVYDPDGGRRDLIILGVAAEMFDLPEAC